MALNSRGWLLVLVPVTEPYDDDDGRVPSLFESTQGWGEGSPFERDGCLRSFLFPLGAQRFGWSWGSR